MMLQVLEIDWTGMIADLMKKVGDFFLDKVGLGCGVFHMCLCAAAG